MLKVTIPSLDKETNLPASTGGLRVTVQKAKDLEGKYESPFGMIDPFDSINFRDEGIVAPNGMEWQFNKNDVNTFLAKEKSEGQMDSITFSVLKTIHKGEEKYIASYEQGKLTLKGDAELTRGQIELAYKQIKEQKVLKALQNNDKRYLNMEGVTRDLQKWFHENSVELRNQ